MKNKTPELTYSVVTPVGTFEFDGSYSDAIMFANQMKANGIDCYVKVKRTKI